MAQQQMDQMAQALQNLQVQIQNQNAQIQNQNALIANVQAAAAVAAPADGAAAHGAGPRFRLNFATYTGEGPNAESDYEAFEQNIRVVARAQNYQFPDVAHAVLAQVRGRAAHMVRDLVDHVDDFADMDAFLDRLRHIFISPAFMEKARSAFYLRLQQKNESIISYHGTMRSLFERAFPADERHDEVLRRQFVAGLSNAEIMKELHLNGQDMDYAELLQESMRLEGSYEILRMNQLRRQHGGQLSAQQHLMMFQHPTGSGAAAGAVPMELGNINRSPAPSGQQRHRGDFRGRLSGFGSSRGRGGRTGNGNGPHPSRNTGTNLSGGRSGPFRPPNQGFQPRPAPSVHPSQQARSDTSTLHPNQCLACQGYGHWSYECSSKKKTDERQARQNRSTQPTLGRSRGYPNRGQPQRGRSFVARPQLHNVEDGASSDTKN